MDEYTLGNKIYELRKKKNLTQEDLALLLDISDKAVSKWENGTSKPTIENLSKLSKILDISLDELITLEEKKNKQKINKIVLTGGPCAGKTTAMNWIQNFFQKQGYKVLFVPETATELITGGLTPWETKTNSDFQSILFDLQLEKEKLFEEGAKKLPNDKILIVCDRGILDNKAYMTKRDFDYLLKSKRLSEIKLRDSYDAVFHLVTAAKGAKKYYNLDNEARTETIEEASRLDDLLISSWTGHPHLRIIDNTCDFEEKMKKKYGSADYASASDKMRAVMVRAVNEDLTYPLPEIDAPTLLVWGENDDATPLSDGKTMERLIPDAGLIVMPESGHYAFLQNIGWFSNIVRNFCGKDMEEV